MKYRIRAAGLALAIALISSPAQAANWQIGIVAENSRSPFLDDKRETNVLPLISYIGEKISYADGKIQYKLRTENNSEIYIQGQMRPRQFYSASLDFDEDLGIVGLEDRSSAFELGLGIQKQTSWGQLLLEGSHDVTGAHEGYEITAKYSYPKQMGRWILEPSIGLQWQSSALVDYYHGVRSSEVRENRAAYQGDRAINPLASLMLGYAINPQLITMLVVEQIVLDSSITDSPIIEEKRLRKIQAGIVYTF